MTDLAAAACVGLSQIAIGHPFDTSLTLIQNKKPWYGLSPKSYYRGWKYPLCSSLVFNIIAFPLFERSLNYTDNILISGLLTGICVSPSVFCFEFGKIRKTNIAIF